jgi:hypothetical protein
MSREELAVLSATPRRPRDGPATALDGLRAGAGPAAAGPILAYLAYLAKT